MIIVGILAKFGFGPKQEETTLIAMTKVLKSDKCGSLSKDRINKLLPFNENYIKETQIWTINKKDSKFTGKLSLNSAGQKSQPVFGIIPDDKKFIAYAEGTADTSASYYAVKRDAGRYFRGYQTAHDCEGDVDLQCPYIVGPIENQTIIEQNYKWVESIPCRAIE